jgi:hypothetical protein
MRKLAAALVLAACAGGAMKTSAADTAPAGAWRATNDCFLFAFLLADDGHVEAAYMTGEADTHARWSWDGTTLTITSTQFDKDSFSGRVVGDRIEADYVWHDLDKDQLNRQACTFERLPRLF